MRLPCPSGRHVHENPKEGLKHLLFPAAFSYWRKVLCHESIHCIISSRNFSINSTLKSVTLLITSISTPNSDNRLACSTCIRRRIPDSRSSLMICDTFAAFAVLPAGVCARAFHDIVCFAGHIYAPPLHDIFSE